MGSHPNLILEDTLEKESYKAKGQQQDGPNIPDRSSPKQHGEELVEQFQRARSTVEKYTSEQVAAIKAKNGYYYDFASAPNFILVTKSLEAERSGIRLCNVRTEKINDEYTTFATVFIPEAKESIFLKKIQQYSNEITANGEPKNKNLVSSIERISAAVVKSLWTDKEECFPGSTPIWCEIWLRLEPYKMSESVDNLNPALTEFRRVCERLDIPYKAEFILFPERAVVMAHVNEAGLGELLSSCSYLAEFRKASELNDFFLEQRPNEQREWVDDVLARTKFERSLSAVCVIDTGVNSGHPLLSSIIPDNAIYKVRDNMNDRDMIGHGTEIAGVVAYNDLVEVLTSSDEYEIKHSIESVKLIDNIPNEPDLYGNYTSRAVALAELGNPKLVHTYCMSITADNVCDDGRPSSWSAAIDQITSGVEDETKRLFLISAGNVPLSRINEAKYPDANTVYSAEDPAQSWNALVIGAYTEKIRIGDPEIEKVSIAAELQGLSPFSSTSAMWDQKWPIKPDILCEGGNAVCYQNGSYDFHPNLSMLTTGHRPTSELFSVINGTSAAVGQASNYAARLVARYPALWPETIRALLVASADWTKPMLDTYLTDKQKKGGVRKLLRHCGYGVANLTRAEFCTENAVNMIIEGELKPFEKRGDYIGFHEMHIHDLPWPDDELLDMGEIEVTLKVVLSYFIEPSPGEIGWKDKYRYPSCGLRFDVNNPNESIAAFKRRINAKMQDDEYDKEIEVSNDATRWFIGERGRTAGSLHCDIWKGTAAQLSTSNYVAVFPTTGWWRTRPGLHKVDKTVRYSLVVTLTTPSNDVDLYTPIITKIRTAIINKNPVQHL